MMKHLIAKFFFACVLVVVVNACKEDEPPLPDNLAAFETDAAGMEKNQSETDLNVTLGRAETTPVEVVLKVTATKLTYDQEYTTTPAATNGEIKLTIPAGQTSGKIKVSKKAGAALNGDEKLNFKIASVTSPVLVGSKTELNLSFSAIVSETGSLVIVGATDESPYFNSIYVDMSGNKMTAVPRKSWNLGFYSGTEFRVIINPGYQGTAKAIDKTDLASVTIADTAKAQLTFGIGEGTNDLVDDWTGDLTKTAIAEVSATEASNKVHLVSFEDGKTPDKWFKVKITRNGTGYKVQYARVGETAIKTLEIPKDPEYNFVFASLETNKIVPVEPRKGSWDFEWSYSTYNSGLNTPYWFQDFVLINHLAGVEAAEVMTSAVTYANFAKSNLTGLTFSKSRDAIGSKWRSGGGPSSAPAVRSDRFYVLKDPAGNYYKLRFTSLGAAGKRGRPEFEYALLK